MHVFNEIPVIDISPIFENDLGMLKVAEDIKNVYTKIGFAYIMNHNIDESLINKLFEASKKFHDLPLNQKLKIRQNKFFRGFLPQNTSIIKSSTLGVATKPNQSEAFILAHEVPENSPDYIAGFNLAGPNQWPEDLPGFKETVIKYRDELIKLSQKMLEVFAVAFGLEKTGLNDFFKKPTYFLRLQYYPEQPDIIQKDQFGIAPHTDYGFFTFLYQDSIGGLQVRNPNKKWIDIPYLHNTLILNTGDMIKIFTDNVYLSTPHRVINTSGKKGIRYRFFGNQTWRLKFVHYQNLVLKI